MYLQTGVYHHVTGVDASSSASLAAYVNTLTYSSNDKTHKIVSGLYWLVRQQMLVRYRVNVPIAATMRSRGLTCVLRLRYLGASKATV